MRILSVFLGYSISLAFVPQVSAENILELYQDAVNNDLTMRAASAKLRAGQENVNIARGALLPQIIAGAGISYNDNDQGADITDIDAGFSPDGYEQLLTESTTITTKGWQAQISQQLFNMGSWYNFKAGQALSDSAEIEFRKSQQDLIVKTTRAYLDVLRAHNNLESSIAEEKAVKQQLDQTQQRFDVGLVAITDVYESRAVYDLAKVSRLTYEGVLESSYEGLTVLTGRKYSQIQPLSENLPITLPIPAEREAWLELALQGNPDLMMGRKTTASAKYKSDSARSAHYPTLSLSAIYRDQTISGEKSFPTQNSDIKVNADADVYTESTEISLQLTVPIYSGGTISANRRQAYAQYDQARETLAASERAITQGVRAAHISVLTSIQEVNARKQSIKSAQSAVDAIQAGYNYGTRNIVDVLNAQRNLFSSQRDYANARYDYILRLLELKQTAGVLNPSDIQALNQWISIDMEAKMNPANT